MLLFLLSLLLILTAKQQTIKRQERKYVRTIPQGQIAHRHVRNQRLVRQPALRTKLTENAVKLLMGVTAKNALKLPVNAPVKKQKPVAKPVPLVIVNHQLKG